MSGPQARRDQLLDKTRTDLVLPQTRRCSLLLVEPLYVPSCFVIETDWSISVHRYADPLGQSEVREIQSSSVVKQNQFLKDYIKRLQNQLQEYLGTYLPPASAQARNPYDIIIHRDIMS